MLFRLIILLLTFNTLVSQNETKKWFFGNGAGLDFLPGTPTVVTGGALTTSLGCASVADNNGSLLFYTNGTTVYNQTHNIMANGSGLNGGGVAQSAIIIKRPSSNSIYYVFSLQSGGLYYSQVDMSLAAGNGSVTIKNATLYVGSCSQQMTATKQCNGLDNWVLAICGGSFCAFSVTSAGVNPVAAISTPSGCVYGFNGCMKLSPNGRKLAVASTDAPTLSSTPFSKVSLFDFDNATGIVGNGFYVSNPPNYSINNVIFSYGCEFSSDGSKLYFDCGGLQQYNLCNPVGQGSLAMVYSNNDGLSINLSLKRSFQLAPNGQIYITLSTGSSSSNPAFVPTNSLGLINFPNLTGSSCVFNPIGQSVGSFSVQWGLPNFMGSFFEQKPVPNFYSTANSDIGCLTNKFFPTQVCTATGYSVTGYQWNFGEPSSGPANFSFLVNPIHTYSSTGTYAVQLIRHFTCFSDTIIKLINVSTPTVNVQSPSMSCGVATATAFVTGGTGPYSYTWTPSAQTLAIANFTNPSGVYSITVNDNGGGCSITRTVHIANTVLNPTVTTTNPHCFGLSNGSASVAMSGGSASYTYTWTGTIQNGSVVSNLSSGIYTVTIQDLNNLCLVTKTFVINQPGQLALNMVSGSPGACVGSTVMLWANVNGGTAPYQYLWSNGPPAQVYVVSQNLPGTYLYSMSVTDSHSCIANNTVAVSFINSPVLLAPSVSVCSQNQVNLIASGASAYTWMPGNYNGNPYTVSPSSTSIFTVTGDSLGCSATATMQVTVLARPNLTIIANSPLCVGQIMYLNSVSNGTQFQWYGPNGFLSSSQSTSISGVGLMNTGIYTLVVTGANSCQSFSNVGISVLANPVISITGNTMICKGETHTLCANGATNYNWSTGSNANIIIVTPNITTTYSLTGSLAPVGCVTSTLVTVKVFECTDLNEQFDPIKQLNIYPNPNSGEFTIEVNEASKLIITNLLGKPIYSFELARGSTFIQLNNCSNGVYFVNLETNGFIRTIKLMLE